MLHRQEELVRVGVRIVLIAAVVGLLVLLMHGTAYPADERELARAAELLSVREPLTSAERLQEAEATLARERRSRLAGLTTAFARLTWSAALAPGDLLDGARDCWRQVRRWGSGPAGGSAALDLLEPDVRAGLADGRARSLYEDLRREESPAAPAEIGLQLRSAGSALRTGRLRTATRALVAASEQLLDLRDPLRARDDEEWNGGVGPLLPDVAAGPLPESDVLPWESSLAAAVLAGRYEHAAELGPPLPEADLARAAALYLSGERGESLASLEELSDEDPSSSSARTARLWLDDPRIDPAAPLLREQRSYRLRRALGWFGGDPLEERGLELSGDGVRSWSRALAPLNLLVSFPARVIRGRGARSDDLRFAAERYLAAEPAGPYADEASRWLEETSRSEAELHSDAAWDDARLVLPRARTARSNLAPAPVLLTRELIETLGPDLRGVLDPRLGDAEALLVLPEWESALDSERALEAAPARAMFSGIAEAVERGHARALAGGDEAALDALRRFDAHVRSGRGAALQAWSAETDAGAALSAALVDDRVGRLEGAELTRGSDDVRAAYDFAGSGVACPRFATCLDRRRAVQTVGIASIDMGGRLRLGAQASFADASVGLQLRGLRPAASLVLPVSRWLGFSNWLRMDAQLGVGADGLWIRPEIREPVEDESRSLAPR
jgi:hypothetical protein